MLRRILSTSGSSLNNHSITAAAAVATALSSASPRRCLSIVTSSGSPSASAPSSSSSSSQSPSSLAPPPAAAASVTQRAFATLSKTRTSARDALIPKVRLHELAIPETRRPVNPDTGKEYSLSRTVFEYLVATGRPLTRDEIWAASKHDGMRWAATRKRLSHAIAHLKRQKLIFAVPPARGDVERNKRVDPSLLKKKKKQVAKLWTFIPNPTYLSSKSIREKRAAAREARVAELKTAIEADGVDAVEWRARPLSSYWLAGLKSPQPQYHRAWAELRWQQEPVGYEAPSPPPTPFKPASELPRNRMLKPMGATR